MEEEAGSSRTRLEMMMHNLGEAEHRRGESRKRDEEQSEGPFVKNLLQHGYNSLIFATYYWSSSLTEQACTMG